MDEQEYKDRLLDRLDLIVHQVCGLMAIGLVALACVGPLVVQVAASLLAFIFATRAFVGFLRDCWRQGWRDAGSGKP